MKGSCSCLGHWRTVQSYWNYISSIGDSDRGTIKYQCRRCGEEIIVKKSVYVPVHNARGYAKSHGSPDSGHIAYGSIRGSRME